MKTPVIIPGKRLVFVLLAGLLCLSRFYGLPSFPIFNDQAIYIRWAQILLDYPSPENAFISLVDAKQPLSIWLTAALLPFFDDPVMAQRVLAAMAGVGGILLAGHFLASRFSFEAGVAFLFLSLVSPLILFFSRVAAVESLLLFFSVAAFVCLWELYTSPGISLWGALLAVALFAGFMNKSPILLVAAASAAFPYIFRHAERFRKRLSAHFMAIGGMLAAPLSLEAARRALGIWTSDSSSQLFFNSSIFAPEAVWGERMERIVQNFASAFSFMEWYATLPLLAASAASFWILRKRKEPIALLSLAFLFLPLVIACLAVTKGHFVPRYFLICFPFLIIPLSVLLGGWLEEGRKGTLPAVVLLGILPGHMSLEILKDPANAPLHTEDRFGYVTNWTSGYGMNAAASFLKDAGKSGKVLVLTDFSWGHPADGIAALLRGSGVTVRDSWWWFRHRIPVVPGGDCRFRTYVSSWVSMKLPAESMGDYTRIFFICRDPARVYANVDFQKINPNLKLVRAFPRPHGGEAVHVYEWDGKPLFSLGNMALEPDNEMLVTMLKGRFSL